MFHQQNYIQTTFSILIIIYVSFFQGFEKTLPSYCIFFICYFSEEHWSLAEGLYNLIIPPSTLKMQNDSTKSAVKAKKDKLE